LNGSGASKTAKVKLQLADVWVAGRVIPWEVKIYGEKHHVSGRFRDHAEDGGFYLENRRL
jgi:hypothetical protein